MITNSREVLDPAATNQNDRMLLEVVADSRDIGCYLNVVSEPYSSYLSQGRIRFLGSRRKNPDTNASFLGAGSQSRRFTLLPLEGAALSD